MMSKNLIQYYKPEERKWVDWVSLEWFVETIRDNDQVYWIQNIEVGRSLKHWIGLWVRLK